jgi:hypothetical protein
MPPYNAALMAEIEALKNNVNTNSKNNSKNGSNNGNSKKELTMKIKN